MDQDPNEAVFLNLQNESPAESTGARKVSQYKGLFLCGLSQSRRVNLRLYIILSSGCLLTTCTSKKIPMHKAYTKELECYTSGSHSNCAPTSSLFGSLGPLNRNRSGFHADSTRLPYLYGLFLPVQSPFRSHSFSLFYTCLRHLYTLRHSFSPKTCFGHIESKML